MGALSLCKLSFQMRLLCRTFFCPPQKRLGCDQQGHVGTGPCECSAIGHFAPTDLGYVYTLKEDVQGSERDPKNDYLLIGPLLPYCAELVQILREICTKIAPINIRR